MGVHERTSVKEHLVRHGSKHKMQVHTTERNKQQQKQNRTHFQNKKQRETRERLLTKTNAGEKMEIDGCSIHTLTHSHALTRACTSTHPPIHPPPSPHTHAHTQDLGERRGKGGFDRHTFYKTRDCNINRK